jgi:hypothetical protein
MLCHLHQLPLRPSSVPRESALKTYHGIRLFIAQVLPITAATRYALTHPVQEIRSLDMSILKLLLFEFMALA